LKAACERLLHPSAGGGEVRARQLRLLEVLLAAPVLAALATAEIALRRGGMEAALLSTAMVFGVGLLAPVALIVTGRSKFIEPLALALAAIATGVVVAGAGGIASPLAVMVLSLVIEASWVARTRRAVAFGLVAAGAAVVLGAGGAGFWATEGAIPSATQWLVPLIYAATILMRLAPLTHTKEEPASETPTLDFEEIMGAATLRFQPTGDVVYASPQAEEVLGVAPEILLGSGLFDRIHVADRITWLSAVSDMREGAGARMLRLRIRVPAEKGVPTHAAYRTFICDLVAGPKGEGMIALLRHDAVTAALEEELGQARLAAEGAELARDQLLASVSHELRTPLNAIVGFSDVLANEMFGKFANDKQREYITLIREAGGHLLSVVNTILDVSKLRSGSYELKSEPFRFDDAVRLCMAMTAHQAEAKSVDLRAEIDEDVGTVHCDRRALQQVLINLLSNAVKFTPAGEVKVTARRSGDRLEFTVSDTGIGISAEDLKKVGRPFMQVQNDYTRQCEGTGLGLALVKGLVKLQGGGMSIESAPGAGTRVHISLPATPVETRHEWEDLGWDEPEAANSGANRNDEWYNDALRKSA